VKIYIAAKTQVAVMIFSVIAMSLSAFGAYNSIVALGRTSDISFYAQLERRPDLIEMALANNEKRKKFERQVNSDLAAKEISSSLYNSTAKIGNQTSIPSLVEFVDYKCAYCKASLQSIEENLSINKSKSILIRQLPILGNISNMAAKYALASLRQGKFAAVHSAFLRNSINSENDIISILVRNGVDVAKARAFVHSPDADKLLEEDGLLAKKMDLHGTPAFVIDGTVTQGWDVKVVRKALS